MRIKDIGIDLGTTNLLIYKQDEGIVLKESSLIAVENNSKKIVAIGNKAYDMLGRVSKEIQVISPLREGVVADFDSAEIMINYFIKNIKCRNLFVRPRLLICCPSNISQVEKNAIKEIGESTGARKVYIEDKIVAAAIGSGIDISTPKGNMIVDIGSGTTDIAVISLNSIVCSKSIKIAGNTFDEDIIKYIKDKYGLIIGKLSAEKIKISIGSLSKQGNIKSKTISGKDFLTGYPKSINITSKDIYEAVSKSIDKIIESIISVLEALDPEISSDIIETGILISGGSALFDRIDKYLKKKLGLPIKISSNPLTCVAEGIGIMLNDWIK